MKAAGKVLAASAFSGFSEGEFPHPIRVDTRGVATIPALAKPVTFKKVRLSIWDELRLEIGLNLP